MKRLLYVLAVVLGVSLLYLASGVFDTEQMKTVSGLCYGLGSVFTVLGTGYFIYSLVITEEKAREYNRQNKIEVNDERNVAIKEKAASMVSHIMTYLLSASIIVFSFLNIDKVVILTISLLLLGKAILFVVFSNYYAKKI